MQLKRFLKFLILLFFIELFIRTFILLARVSSGFARLYNQFIAPSVFPFYLVLTLFELVVFFSVFSRLKSVQAKTTHEQSVFSIENFFVISMLSFALVWYIIFQNFLHNMPHVFGVISIMFYLEACIFTSAISLRTLSKLKHLASLSKLWQILLISSLVILINLTFVPILRETLTGIYNLKLPMLPSFMGYVIYTFVFLSLGSLWMTSTMLTAKTLKNHSLLILRYLVPFLPLMIISAVYLSLDTPTRTLFALVAGWAIPADFFGFLYIFGDYTVFVYALAFGLYLSGLLQLLFTTKSFQEKERVSFMIYGYALLFFPGMFNEPFYWLCKIIAIMLIELFFHAQVTIQSSSL